MYLLQAEQWNGEWYTLKAFPTPTMAHVEMCQHAAWRHGRVKYRIVKG